MSQVFDKTSACSCSLNQWEANMDSPTIVVLKYTLHIIIPNMSPACFCKCADSSTILECCSFRLFLFSQPVVHVSSLLSPGKSSVELAVTGTGLPVVLVPYPSHDFDFGTCKEGQRVDLLCVLQNLCPLLPIIFRFQKLAHFATEPSTGKIPPGQYQVKSVSGLMMC